MVDIIIPENGSKQGQYLNILAKLDLERPLMRGIKIKCNGQEV